MIIFVYGTLRVGGGNNSLVSSADLIIENCKTRGRMWNVRGDDPIFPVTDFNCEDGTIVGDLIMTEDARTFYSVDAMECGAGYARKMVTVEFPDDPVTIEALAYHWPEGQRRGAPVPDGDWIAWRDGRRAE